MCVIQESTRTGLFTQQTVPKLFLATVSFTHTLLGDFAMWKDVVISGIWWPRFWIWFFMSLFCFSLPLLLSGQQDGGFVVLFFQLIFITGTHKTAQASLPPFIISYRNSGASQGCRKPSPIACTQLYKTFTLLMHVPALHLQDLGRPARKTCHSSGLTQGTDRVAGNW